MSARKKIRHRWLLAAIIVPLAALTVCVVLGLVWLKRGISVTSIDLGAVSISQLDLALDRKLSLSIDSLTVNLEENEAQREASQPPGPKQIKRALAMLDYISKLFRSIEIREIRGDDLQGRFSYRENQPGYLALSTSDAEVEFGLGGTVDHLVIDLVRMVLMNRGIQASGRLDVEVDQRLLSGQLRVLVAETLPVELELDVDPSQFSFRGRGLESVEDIAPIVDLFQLGPAITPWISEYLVGSEFALKDIHGVLPFNDPGAIVQTLRAEAHVRDVSYTFAQGIDPIVAQSAEVVFERGVLNIYPREGTFYGYDGRDSHLDIDFNQSDFPLTASINAYAQASGGILDLLDHYHIPFPLEQTEGMADVDLTLRIALRTIEINVDGRFRAQDSKFKVAGHSYQVAALDVGLVNTTELDFRRLELDEPAFSVNIRGGWKLRAGLGELALGMTRLQWPAQNPSLRLQPLPESPATAWLKIDPGGHELSLPATRWRYGERNIVIDAFTTPLVFADLSGRIPPTDVTVDKHLHAQVSGDFVASKPSAGLQIILQRLSSDQLRLAQKRAALSVRFDKTLWVAIAEPVKFDAKGVPLVVQRGRIEYRNGLLRILDGGLAVGAGITTGISGEVDTLNSKGTLTLTKLRSRDSQERVTFEADEVNMALSQGSGSLQISAPELALNANFAEDGSWSLHCPDLSILHTRSYQMQQLGLEKGEMHLSSPADSRHYLLKGRLDYPYALLMQDGKATGTFHFDGWYNGSQARLVINDKLMVDMAGSTQIKSQGVGYNLPELLRLARDDSARAEAESAGGESDSESEADDSASGRLTLHARDTHLKIDDTRSILADNLVIAVADSRVKLDLQHRAGMAVLQLQDGQLHLAGARFGPQFIAALAGPLADIDRGQMEFRVGGSLDEIEAVLAIRNTTIKDYKTLNNMLAFINTLPGALTFNPPNYDKEGLPVEELSASLTFSDGVMDLKSMLIDSRELTVRGSGELDFKRQTTDMTFNLVTGARKSVSRIPILGYILTGKGDKSAIALKVEGDLNDPEVSNTAFEEVVTYPFKVLARTILLPVYLVQSLDDGAEQNGDSVSGNAGNRP